MSGQATIHEPHCNTNCREDSHHLASGVGMPHLHQTNLSECGECKR